MNLLTLTLTEAEARAVKRSVKDKINELVGVQVGSLPARLDTRITNELQILRAALYKLDTAEAHSIHEIPVMAQRLDHALEAETQTKTIN